MKPHPSWRPAMLYMARSTCEQCVEERWKIIVQGGVSRECLDLHDMIRKKLIFICYRQLLVVVR